MKTILRNLFLYSALTLLFTTCNKKKEGPCFYPEDKAQLYITVINEFGEKVDNALINVFDSYQNFENARSQKNALIFAYDSIRSSSVSEAQLMANSKSDNWILVSFFDPSLNRYLSSELTVSKIEKIQSCSDYHITINIAPVGAVVAFWTDSPINVPIAVKFNNVLDTLYNTTTFAPISPANPGAPTVLMFGVSDGTYQYQATSANGCTWKGEVTLSNGQFTTVKLDGCERALIAFYYNTASFVPTDKQTITVYLDNNPVPVGTLTAPVLSVAPTNSCNTPAVTNVLYVYAEPGVIHTYKAQSITGGGTVPTPCLWTGTIAPLDNNCTLNVPVYLGQGCD